MLRSFRFAGLKKCENSKKNPKPKCTIKYDELMLR